jgi:hypothetical protein
VSALFLLAAPARLAAFGPLDARYPIRPFPASLAFEAIRVLSANVSRLQFERLYVRPSAVTYQRSAFAA